MPKYRALFIAIIYLLYATKVNEGFSKVPEVENPTQVMHATKESNDFAVAPMGWALKVTRTPVRFSTKQKGYLTKRFELGEETGLKADPADVATDMKSTLDETGKRRFKNDELLRPQQIAGYFSRLAARKRLATDPSVAEGESAQVESNYRGLVADVMREVSFQHPIVYDTYNVCSLVEEGKLHKLALGLLKEMCVYLEVETSDLKQRRKKPYIKIITDLVKDCSCMVK